MNWGDLSVGLGGQLFGQLRLGNVYVGQVSDLSNIFGSQGQPVKFTAGQQRAQILQAALHVRQFFTIRAVADFQVVV